MTRKRYIKLVTAVCEKHFAINGGHLKGKDLKWFRDFYLTKTLHKSYAEAWEEWKPLRDCVNM